MADSFDPFAAGGDDDPGEERVPLDLEFDTIRHFREEMAPYLGERGFFARTEHPLPQGTQVQFRFVLPEGFVLAEGTAAVAWNIEPETHPDLIPGMALRFVEMGDQSRSVILELIDFHIATGGDPFEVGPAADSSADIPTDALGGGQEEASRDPGRDAEGRFEPESHGGDGSDEVLPDWLLSAAGRSPDRGERAVGRERADAAETPRTPAEGERGDLQIDLAFDDLGSEPSPFDDGPREPVAEAVDLPSVGAEQPRDLRWGLLAAAALTVIAIVVLAWSLWLRSDAAEERALDGGSEPAAVEIVEPAPSGTGVELLEDDATADGPAPAKDRVSEAPPLTPDATPLVVVERPQPDAADTAPARAARVVDVVAAARPGETTVVIRGDGFFTEDAVRAVSLEDPPRIWVRLRHIETFYRPNEIVVNSPEVLRIRIGHHPEESPPSLYVVLDVTDPAVAVSRREVEGDTVRLSVSRR